MGAFWQPRMRLPLQYCLRACTSCWQRVWGTSHYGPPVPHPLEYLSALSTFLGRLDLPPPSLALMGRWAPAHQQDGGQLLSGQGTKTGQQRHCNLLIYSDYLIYNITVTQSVQS